MQVFGVLPRVLLVALAASAAKLPLLPPEGPNVNAAPLTTLYEAPLADLPSPAQPPVIVQSPPKAPQNPAHLSTLNDAPVEDIPSVPSTSLFIQNQAGGSSLPGHTHALPNSPVANLPAPSQQSVIIPTPEQPSLLYDLPSENKPALTQQSTVAVVPGVGEPSTSFGLPVGTFPAPAQQPTVNVVSGAGEPSTSFGLPVGTFPAPAQQPTVNIASGAGKPSTSLGLPVETFPDQAQQPTLNIVTGVGEPSTSLGLPVETFPVPAQQPTGDFPSPVHQTTLAQAPLNVISEPDQPSGLYEIPSANLHLPAVESSVAQGPLNVIPIPDEQTTLQGAPSGSLPSPSHEPSSVHPSPSTGALLTGVPAPQADLPFDVLNPAPAHQSSAVQTPSNIIPVPAKPSTLYDVPFEAVLPAVVQTPSETVPAPNVPSASYETPVVDISTPQQSTLAQTPVQLITVPDEPAGSFPLPSQSPFSNQGETSLVSHTHSQANLPTGFDTPAVPVISTQTIQLTPVESIPKVEQSEYSNQPITFPEQAPAEEYVPVPEVPSTLYDLPESSAFLPVQTSGKAMIPGDEFQSDFDAAPSSQFDVPVAANTLQEASPAMMPMPYDFSWGVQDSSSGNTYTHHENNNGKYTSGQYKVNLPDGRVQVVNYYDNGSGFHADVTYE